MPYYMGTPNFENYPCIHNEVAGGAAEAGAAPARRPVTEPQQPDGGQAAGHHHTNKQQQQQRQRRPPPAQAPAPTPAATPALPPAATTLKTIRTQSNANNNYRLPQQPTASNSTRTNTSNITGNCTGNSTGNSDDDDDGYCTGHKPECKWKLLIGIQFHETTHMQGTRYQYTRPHQFSCCGTLSGGHERLAFAGAAGTARARTRALAATSWEKQQLVVCLFSALRVEGCQDLDPGFEIANSWV